MFCGIYTPVGADISLNSINYVYNHFSAPLSTSSTNKNNLQEYFMYMYQIYVSYVSETLLKRDSKIAGCFFYKSKEHK